MPSLSQQQQKLMGLALAYKRGKVSTSDVSKTVKQLANSMSEKELEKYASTKHKGLPKKVGETKTTMTKEEINQLVSDAVQEVMNEKFSTKVLTSEQKQQYIEAISRYNEYRSVVHRSKTLPEIVSEIKRMVEFASKNMVEESGDWFEGVSHRRNSKRLKESVSEFQKISERIVKLQRTLESIYENIGKQLGSFYEIKNNKEWVMSDRVYTNSKPAHVKVKAAGMNVDIMIKVFKRKVKEAGILEEYKNRMEYIKPSKRKSEKRNAAIRRQRKIDSENI